MKLLNVVGARPNFMKIAPLMEAYRAHPGIQPLLVHTGQHYDERMSDLFFRELEIPEPDINLGVGSGSHAAQTADIMRAFEPVMLAHRPDAVLVVGDVNSTIACGLVAAKLGARLIHVEAGLRSFDRGMPEEINRVLTDRISDLLFCTERAGVENLLREGADPESVFLAGNVMIDTLRRHLAKARESDVLERLGLRPGEYAALTLHRPSNVDSEAALARLAGAIEEAAGGLPLLFPAHPRALRSLERSEAGRRFCALPNVRLTEPMGYLDFLKAMADARLVLTDSGGIQEETTILGVPCVTLRENTERPVTVEMGTNILAGTRREGIVTAVRGVLARPRRSARSAKGDPASAPDAARIPPLWDGRAAERIARIIAERFGV